MVRCPASSAGVTGQVALAQAFNVSLTSGVATEVTWSGAFWTSDATILKTGPNFNNTDKSVELFASGQWWASMRTQGYSGAMSELAGYIEPVTFTVADGDFANGVKLDGRALVDNQIGAWSHGFFKYFPGTPQTWHVWLKQTSGFARTVTTVSLFVNFVASPTDITQEW